MMVNNPRGAARAKPRIVLLVTAALAALAVAGASSIPPAGASSGSGAVSTDGPSAQASKYESLWVQMSRSDKRWARSTAECESGGDPDAIGGGGLYRGAFQFMKSTWRNAPKSPGGDPIDYGYRTQAVVAVALMRKDGAGHWPNCG
jgi:Transglycosylase-like domain